MASFGVNTIAATFMIIAQIVNSCIGLSYKFALQHGFSLRIVGAFRLVLAATVLLPFAIIIHRRQAENPPTLTWRIVGLIFLCAFLREFVSSSFYAWSLDLGSTTVAMALQNLGPAMTFVLAIVFKLETVQIQTPVGKVKVLGTLISICGALVLGFYKGSVIRIWPSKNQVQADYTQNPFVRAFEKKHHNQTLSVFLALGSCVASSLAVIAQDKILKKYPTVIGSSAIIIGMGALQCFTVAIAINKKNIFLVWRHTFILLVVVFTGAIGTGLMTIVVAWCLEKKGPVYVSSFAPISVVLVTFFSPAVVDEEMHLGSVLGALILVSGVALILWAKKCETGSQDLQQAGGPGQDS